jgi:hypothetical protein
MNTQVWKLEPCLSSKIEKYSRSKARYIFEQEIAFLIMRSINCLTLSPHSSQCMYRDLTSYNGLCLALILRHVRCCCYASGTYSYDEDDISLAFCVLRFHDARVFLPIYSFPTCPLKCIKATSINQS